MNYVLKLYAGESVTFESEEMNDTELEAVAKRIELVLTDKAVASTRIPDKTSKLTIITKGTIQGSIIRFEEVKNVRRRNTKSSGSTSSRSSAKKDEKN